MGSGVDGTSHEVAAQHAGLGWSSGGGGVNVLRLVQGAVTALARQ